MKPIFSAHRSLYALNLQTGFADVNTINSKYFDVPLLLCYFWNPYLNSDCDKISDETSDYFMTTDVQVHQLQQNDDPALLHS